jgi:hypothetical protein
MRWMSIAALALSAPALAQAAEPVCVRQQPVPGFEGWGRAPATALTVGRPALLPLRPAGQVRLVPAPKRKPVAGSYAGYFPVSVAKPGRYEIALSGRAWIELVRGGKSIVSAAHRHGPPCSGMAKIVGFDLKPGRYWVQLSEAPEASISAMIVASAGGRPGA